MTMMPMRSRAGDTDADADLPVASAARGFRPEQLQRIHEILKALGLRPLTQEPGKLVAELDSVIRHKVQRVVAAQLAGPDAIIERTADGTEAPDGTADVYNIVLARVVRFAPDYRGARPESAWPWIRRIAATQAISWVRRDLVEEDANPIGKDESIDEALREAEQMGGVPGAAESRPDDTAKKKRPRLVRLDDEASGGPLLASLASSRDDDDLVELEGYHPVLPAGLGNRVNIYRGNPEALLSAIENRFVGVNVYKRTVLLAIKAARADKKRATCRDILIFHRRHFRGESYDTLTLRYRISTNLAQKGCERGRIAFLKTAKKLGTLPEYPSQVSGPTKSRRP
jgi:hypothetical protein